MKFDLAKLNAKTSPAPNETNNDMIINIAIAAKTKLLDIYRHIWVKRTEPQVRREATKIPIH